MEIVRTILMLNTLDLSMVNNDFSLVVNLLVDLVVSLRI